MWHEAEFWQDCRSYFQVNDKNFLRWPPTNPRVVSSLLLAHEKAISYLSVGERRQGTRCGPALASGSCAKRFVNGAVLSIDTILSSFAHTQDSACSSDFPFSAVSISSRMSRLSRFAISTRSAPFLDRLSPASPVATPSETHDRQTPMFPVHTPSAFIFLRCSASARRPSGVQVEAFLGQ